MLNARILTAGSVGLVSGLCLEKLKRKYDSLNENNLTKNDETIFRQPLPGLPIFGTVSAATPIPSVAETMPAIQSSLTVPDKPIPSAPAPTRCSEIMKFGFPSLANVKARK